ncbi:hypothetical protein BH10PSE17_BH10PSE17_01740 [soil metagenome]
MNRISRNAVRTLVPCALALAIGQAYAQSATQLPVLLGGQPVNGQGAASCAVGGAGACTAVYTSRNDMIVNQTSQNVILNWQSFDIGALGGRSTVRFNQPNANSIALNRVTSTGVGRIDGSLSSNGRLFIVAPGGLLISNNGTISTGGLVATTMALSDDDFLTGAGGVTGVGGTNRFAFTQAATIDDTKSIENRGTISGAIDGTAQALFGNVLNSGTISAPRGSVIMANAQTVQFDLAADNTAAVAVPTRVVINAISNGDAVGNSGTLTAEGGQIILASNAGSGANALASGVTSSGSLAANSIGSTNGRIVLVSVGTSMGVAGSVLAVGDNPGERGGSINIVTDQGVQILQPVSEFAVPTSISTSGFAGGGSINVVAGGVRSRTLVNMSASALVDGDGGSINLNGSTFLVAASNLQARGAGSGQGGTVFTQTPGLIDLRGVRVDVGASGTGAPGTWAVQAPELSIVHADTGEAEFPGGLPTRNVLQDGAINRSLNTGSNVNVRSTGSAVDNTGVLVIEDQVAIARTAGGTRASTLSLRADDSVIASDGFSIASSSGALNVTMESNLGSDHSYSQIRLFSGDIRTNGGTVALTAHRRAALEDPTDPGAAIQLSSSTIDTRLRDGTGGAAITLSGEGNALGGVSLSSNVMTSGTGNITIRGVGDLSSGAAVFLDSGEGVNAISATSGNIVITGNGDRVADGTGLDGPAYGVYVAGGTIRTQTGTIDIAGLSSAPAGSGSGGLFLGNADIGSTSGAIRIAGSSTSGSTGLFVDVGTIVNAGSGVVTVRAESGAGIKPIELDGAIASTTAVDLRPGFVNADGTVSDRVGTTINLGTATVGAGSSFAVSAAELGRITSPVVVFGSNAQTGDVNVVGAITRTGNVTLQTGGAIALNAPVNVGTGTLGLLAGGNITQSAPITAGQVAARSGGGTATLANAGNNVATVAGAGNLSYTDANAVTIGSVSVTGVDAATQGTQVVASNGITGGDVVVRTLAGNLSLGANVSGGNIDLVSAGIFNNTANAAITATGNWRVWADTYVGENRGGLTGSGPLPNLYNCSYLGACGVIVTAGSNHFVYRVQPTAVVTVGNANREYGLANPAFGFDVTGIRAGDLVGNAITGAATTVATLGSNVGNYAIGGTFVSPAGYAVQVQGATLRIDPATLTYVATPLTRLIGTPNGTLTGTTTGYRNGDTQGTATSGTVTFTTNANADSPAGSYGVVGSGLTAGNYVFVQAPANLTALTVESPITTPAFRYLDLIASSSEVVGATSLGGVFYQVERDPPSTYVYDRNFAPASMCVSTDPTLGRDLQSGDVLAIEWSRVKSRPNLTNCVATDKSGGCSDF